MIDKYDFKYFGRDSSACKSFGSVVRVFSGFSSVLSTLGWFVKVVMQFVFALYGLFVFIVY